MSKENILEHVMRVDIARNKREAIMQKSELCIGDLVDKLLDNTTDDGDGFQYNEIWDVIHQALTDYTKECVDIEWKHLVSSIKNHFKEEHDDD